MNLLDWFKVPASFKQIDDAQLAAQHVTLQKQLRRMRMILTVTVLSLILIFLIAAKARVEAIPGDEVASHLEKRADVIANRLGDAAGEVIDEAGPVLGDAVGKEAATAIEDMQRKLDTEMSDLEKSITQRFRTAYERELETVRGDGAKLLQENFPQLKGDEKKTEALLANFQDGVQTWAQKQLVTTFKRHIDAMFRIKVTLNKMVLDGPRAPVDIAEHVTGEGAKGPVHKIQPERLLEMWIELVSDALGGSEDEGDLLDPSTDAKKRAKEAAKEITVEDVKVKKVVEEESKPVPATKKK